MDAQSIVVAVSSLSGVLLGGGLQFLFGRALESRKQLLLQRGQSYVDFLKAVAAAAQQNRSKETLAAAADAKTRICIYGSAAVIKELGRFSTTGANTAAPEGRAVIVDLVKAMRRDIGKTDHAVSERDLLDILFGPEPPESSTRAA
jgi:hypothetical protein